MSFSISSKLFFDAYKEDTIYWPGNLGRLKNMTEYFKSVKKNFEFNSENREFCLSIRSGSEKTFAEGVKEQVTTAIGGLCAESEGLKGSRNLLKSILNIGGN